MTRDAATDTRREERLGELLLEWLDARRDGRPIDRAAFLAAHADFRAELEAFFAGHDVIERVAAPLRAAGEAGDAAAEPDESVGPLGTLGDFRLIREVGRGGMGVVYEAEQLSLRRRVALKVLPFAGVMDPRQLLRFQNEARAAACLHHTHIVPVHAVGVERGVHYYAMQLIDGCNLAQLVRALRSRRDRPTPHDERPARPDSVQATVAYDPNADESPDTENALAGSLSTEPSLRGAAFFRTVAAWGVAAAEALDHAHQVGVVHRDVKPANLLVDAAGQVWVADFGLAQFQAGTDLTMTGDLLGTLRYMSPEQALAQRVLVDHRTDVYSLGATLYELLALEPAFSGKDRQEILRQIAFDEPRPPRSVDPAIPVELETVVLKAMAKNPAERYQTAKELADDLRRWLEDRPILARRPNLLQRARRFVRRHRSVVAVGVAGLLACLAVAGAGLGWILRDRQSRCDVGTELVTQSLTRAAEHHEQRRYPEALVEAQKAEAVANSYPVSYEVRQRAAAFRREVEEAQAAAERDRRLLATILDVGLPINRPIYVRDYTGELRKLGLWKPDNLYAAAFQAWGLVVDAVPTEEAAARLTRRPAEVVAEVVAALDAWTAVRRRLNGDWRRLAALARALEAGAQPWQRDLRAIVEGGRLEQERALGEVAALLLPWGRLADLVPGEERNRLRQMAGSIEAGTAPVHGVLALARALETAGDADRAERLLRSAAGVRSDAPVLHQALGELLGRLSPPRRGEAVEWLRSARALRPALGARLAEELASVHRGEEALDLARLLARDQPDNGSLYFKLGVIFDTQDKLAEAEAAYREAIRLAPLYLSAHSRLGLVLAKQGKLADAEASFRGALRIDPYIPELNHDLGIALEEQGKLADAEAAYREAIRRRPNYPSGYFGLGNALAKQGKFAASEAAYWEAIYLKPDFALAYYNLGVALKQQGKLAEAEAAYREAIRLKPDYPVAHFGLGIALQDQGKLAEAEAAFREAIRLKPDFWNAYFYLGVALRMTGQFGDALVALRRAHELGSRTPEWPHPSVQWVRDAERLVELNLRLPAILSGEEQPTSAEEEAEFAKCLHYKQWYAASVRYYQRAFAARPAPASLDQRYDAACAAALAAAGNGKEAGPVPDKGRAAFRRQALDWLREELDHVRNQLADGYQQSRRGLVDQLNHWQRDRDLASVRDPTALGDLRETERVAWVQLWQDVADVLKQAEAPKESVSPSPKP